MERELLETLRSQGLSDYKIADRLGKSYSAIRHWVKKHGLLGRPKLPHRIAASAGFCHRCKTHKDLTDFYSRRNGTGITAYCKPCTSDQTVERQRKFKHQCIEYKGGKCVSCGYHKCDGALHFHHIDPTLKEHTISQLHLTSFSDKVKKELDKCVLLCANCHAETHHARQGSNLHNAL